MPACIVIVRLYHSITTQPGHDCRPTADGSPLTGRYEGRDIHTGNRCQAIISRTGISARAGSLGIQIPQPSSVSVYSKARYTPIAGTSPVGYTLLWSTSYSTTLSMANAGNTDSVYTTFTFNFNSNLDGKLLIEMVERVTAARSNATTTSNAISCEIPL